MKPHALHIVRSFAADGPNSLLASLLSAWDPAQIRVSIMALSPNGPTREILARHTARLGGVVTAGATANKTAAVAFCQANGITHLHAHLLRPDFLARRIAERTGLPCFVTEHGLHAWSEKSPWLRPFVKSWYRSTLNKVARVIAVSDHVERELLAEEIPAAAVVVIPNGVDCAQFTPPSEERKESIRKELQIPAEAFPVVLFAGALRAHKEPALAIAAFAEMRRHWPGAFLLMAGEGPLKGKCSAMIEKLGLGTSAKLLGRVAEPQCLWPAADLMLHPSRSESFGLAVAEAMACGLPAIVRAGGGADELLPPYPAGIAVEGSSSACWGRALADMAGALVSNGAPIRARARAIAERFDIRQTAAAYLSLYR